MALTDRMIRSLIPGERSARYADSKNLYIEVFPSGSKLWRWKYRFGGKEKRLALGAYPEISLAVARRRRDAARAQVDDGIDPSLERKRQKAATKFGVANSFEKVAEEFLLKMEKEQKAESTLKKARWFLSLLKPSIGKLPVADVDPQLLLGALRQIESKGNYETAKKTRSFASRVFRFAVQTGRAKSDPAGLLKDALISPKADHYSAILEPKRFGELLSAIDGYGGYPITRLALQIAPHVFLRPGELRQADWQEIDLEHAIWRVPAGRMKARREHAVPLSRQVIELLKELSRHSGPTGRVFPAFHSRNRPLSENTLNAAFRRMGFSKEEVTAHGLRATASTFLNESGIWNPDAIERALAHGESNAVRGAYHRGLHWEERVKMAQWWSDQIDAFRSAAGKDAASERGS